MRGAAALVAFVTGERMETVREARAGHDHTFVSGTCHNTPATPCDDDGATMGGWGECPCDGTRGCVCQ